MVTENDVNELFTKYTKKEFLDRTVDETELLDYRSKVLVSHIWIELLMAHFNPSLSASSVRFIGAELSNVAFEVDVVESLLRNRLIARHLIVSGRIEIERTDDGWRLKGAEPMQTRQQCARQ